MVTALAAAAAPPPQTYFERLFWRQASQDAAACVTGKPVRFDAHYCNHAQSQCCMSPSLLHPQIQLSSSKDCDACYMQALKFGCCPSCNMCWAFMFTFSRANVACCQSDSSDGWHASIMCYNMIWSVPFVAVRTDFFCRCLAQSKEAALQDQTVE